jgi:putative oxidoreductase
MNSLGFVGKLGFGLVIAFFGVSHFMNATTMTGYVPSYFPLPQVLVYLTGAALIAAGIALIIGKKAQLAMFLLGIMLLGFAVLVHLPRGEAGMGDLLKDIGLACAAWFISAHSKD